MEHATAKLHIGEWLIDPASGEISRGGDSVRLEERPMRLLLCLAARTGEVVSADDLVNEVWRGVAVSQDSVYQAVGTLRRHLGDDSKQPTYIVTVPRLGYRLVASVRPDETALTAGEPTSGTADEKGGRRWGSRWLWIAGLAVLLVLACAFWLKLRDSRDSERNRVVAAPQKTIAVLPFLDLTEGMKEEEFADGVTEELIGRLSKVPGLRVPPPAASFYFKGKQMQLADIAGALHVTYLLDGSVRKSGSRVRITARLTRARNGYVLWTENYERPFADILSIQDQVAEAVTKALSRFIDGGSEQGN